MELLWAGLLIATLAATPAVLFVLFWRFLCFLRDDALIDQLEFTHGIDLTGDPTGDGVVGLPSPPAVEPTPRACPRCGLEGERAGTACGRCDSPLVDRGS